MNTHTPAATAGPGMPDIFHAIADANRRTLLDLLRVEARPVQELAGHFSISLAAISQHLKVLLDAGLVTREARGKYRYYRADAARLREIHDWTAQYRVFWEDRLDRLDAYLDAADPSATANTDSSDT